MNDEQKAAYIIAQSVCVMVKAMGMVAENQHRMDCGNSIAYGNEAFNALIDKSAIHHNAVISLFQDSQ